MSRSSTILTEKLYKIINEMHCVAPLILTTVIGTVTHNLHFTNVSLRNRAVKLLGKLFSAETSEMGTTFAPCYREWTGRIKDLDSGVRLTMSKYLLLVLRHGKLLDMWTYAIDSLCYSLDRDPSLKVRLSAVHRVCDLLYEDATFLPPKLIRSVGINSSPPMLR
mmetsp:Transcript_22811/g.28126  ORF Transcript_22811/g.28126 Transcript_22811/m.28126 type:complete len:164 (+) Transcript_22811:1355-1846(+)